MSLLGNLITQVASSALSSDNQQHQQNNQSQASSGGMGGMLGSVLGGLSGGNAPQAQSNQGGLGDMLGSVLGGASSNNMNMGGAGGLGSVLGSVLGARTGGGKGMLLAALMPMVLSWIQRNGGLSGALGKIKELGFDNQVNSWMSTQTNENLNPNEVNRLFGDDEIRQVAEQTGTDENEVKQGISELLPEVFNQLTPNGDLDTENEANQEIDEILKQISGALTK